MGEIKTRVFSLLEETIRVSLVELGILEETPPQEMAIPRILAGENLLLIAPTGSGKTEAAILPILNSLIRQEKREGISIIYITPLRALNRDMLKRLTEWSTKLKFKVEIRHGDTPVKERRKQSIKPPDLLVTTPETLQAILTGKRMREHLKSVKWVIIDEVHELAESRRGAQLTIALERLQEVCNTEFQRIGLSATVGNPDQIGSFVAGANRKISVVQASMQKQVRYFVEYPYPTEEDHVLAHSLHTTPEATARLKRICELIGAHESTLIFVNSRVNAEMLGSKLSMLRKDVGVHHGSLPKEERVKMEAAFKSREIKALVCTSTLELGIDIGSVNLVLQYMSPRQVASLIQRVGRSGHAFERVSEGIIIVVSTDDILESTAAIQKAQKGEVEPIRIHMNSLDVLAHQVVGILLDNGGRVSKNRVMRIVKKAYPYMDLSAQDFNDVLQFMDKLRNIRIEGEDLVNSWKTRDYYFQNLSMIPDERRYTVIDVTTQQKVGILGEEFMVIRARVGVNFIVKGKVWKIEKIGEDGVVYVTPVEDPTAAIPGWDGEMLSIPVELARHVGALRRRVSEALEDSTKMEEVIAGLKEWPVEPYARRKVSEEIHEHKSLGAPVPDEKKIVIEAFERYLIIHSCFGETVNNTLGEVAEEFLMREGYIRFWWSDAYRILVELTVHTHDFDLNQLRTKIFDVTESVLEGALKSVMHRHGPFGYYMKFIAERFGALKRGLMLSGEALKELTLRFRMTPIYEETQREAMLKHVDLDLVRRIYREIKQGIIAVEVFKAQDAPTPIAYHIMNRYLEAPELIAPDGVAREGIERMRISLDNEIVDLLCFECTTLHQEMIVRSLDDKPRCRNCGSGLLGVIFWSSRFVEDALKKKKRKEKLSEDEDKVLTRVRRSADLVLSYGKKAVIAQSVYGIGPQTALRLLSKMHDEEQDFYRDLLNAKLQFIITRPFWDRNN